MDKNEYFSVRQIAKKIGVSHTTIYNWISEGLKYKTEKILRLKPRKIIREIDVKEFLKLK